MAEARPPTVNRARAGTYAGLFMVTMATLMYEIALTRIFSVTMWYHFAFVAISVALFGLTVGALIVYLLPNRFTEARVKRDLWLFSLLFGVSIAVCITLQLWIKFEPAFTLTGVASVVGTCVVISIPFVLSGVVVCLALTKFPDRVNRLYAADLVGAALGCVVLLVTFSLLDGPSLVVAIGAVAALGAVFFAFDLSGRRGLALAGVAVITLGGIAVVNNELHSRGDPLLRVRWAKESADPKHDYERWNAFSRVTVDGDPDATGRPFSPGFSETMPDYEVSQMGMVIDSTAGTVLTRYDGDPDSTDFLRYDVTNLAHYLRDGGDVLVIGVGGGRDVLSALEFEQSSVTGVEINGDILDITNNVFGDYTGHLDRDPRVDFVTDEARSFLARTEDRYDIIQISLIDTWAATSAGAFALSENSLYTTDAWRVFFDSLAPDGILSVSRWYTTPDSDEPLEMYRATALAAQALKDYGVENPRDHMLIYRGPDAGFGLSMATLMVSPEPFSESDLGVVDENTERLEFPPVLTPEAAPDEHFANLAVPEGPGAEVDRFQLDISPPTDDQPFFFQMESLESLLDGRAGLGDTSVSQPVVVLALLALTVLGLALLCIVVPLLLTTKRTAHRGMLPFYGYFAGIGLGFLLIEVAQLQRLSIYLGHPTYALGVVLFSVLLFSGIGSMLTERFVRVDRSVSLVAPLFVLLVVVVAFGFVTPAVIKATDGATTPVRILIAVALLMPLGLVMGMPFAIGMRSAASRPGAPTAFLWGINGATSVCASVFGVVIALFFGISWSYWIGCLAYVLAAGSMVVITRRATARAGVPEEAPSEGEPALEQAPV